MRSRVMPGSSPTMERREPVRRLKSVDLPTLGRPQMAMSGRLRAAADWAARSSWAARTSASRQARMSAAESDSSWRPMLAECGVWRPTIPSADIRESFSGLLLVLEHVMANEKLGTGENQRVVQASTRMAEAMGLGSDRVELLRSAVLLRDLSKLGISNDILCKAADMSRDEVVASFRKPRKANARA